MAASLEVEPEIGSKIKARALERGVSVDAYLRELIEDKAIVTLHDNGLNPEEKIKLLRGWA